MKVKVKSLSRVRLCDPVDCSPPGSSVHGILQARVLEWVAISFSRGSSQPRDRTRVSCIAGRRFNLWTTREAKLWEITKRLDKNLAQFLARLMETLQKYTKLDPTSAEGTVVRNTHFISQSSPDIQKKLKKVEEDPQTPRRDLLNLAFKIFNNQEEQANLEKDQGDQAKYHLWLKATFLHGSTFPSTKTGSHLGPASNAAKKITGPTHA